MDIKIHYLVSGNCFFSPKGHAGTTLGRSADERFFPKTQELETGKYMPRGRLSPVSAGDDTNQFTTSTL
jgi:hypothetical protein